MFSYQNLRIGRKLLLGFAIMILLAAGACLLGIRGMQLLEARQIELYETALVHNILTNEAYAELIYHNRRFYRHIAVTDPEQMALVESQVTENENNILAALGKYRGTQLDPKEIELLASFDRVWPEYLRLKHGVFQLSAAHKKPEALTLAESETRPSFKELDRILAELHHYNNLEGEESRLEAQNHFHVERNHLLEVLLLILAAGVLLAWWISRSIVAPLHRAVEINEHLARQGKEQLGLIETIANGDLSRTIATPEQLALSEQDLPQDESGDLLRSALHMNRAQVDLSRAMVTMTAALQRSRADAQARDWLKSNINEVNLRLRGDRSALQLAGEILPFLAETATAAVGAIYLHNGEDELELVAGYALPAQPAGMIRLGEGVLGQAAQQRRRIHQTGVPQGFLRVESALGSHEPCSLVALPLVHDGELLGALELGSFHPFAHDAFEFLDQVADSLALALKIARARSRIEDLLEQAQQQTEELRVQQEELQQSNEELEERAQLLEQQREQIGAQNREIEQTTELLQRKAEDLERVSAYKSEFLANMSHELRSPLNSLLILSGLLQENREGHLSEKEIQFAATINAAGRDLLSLINDILDLAKVEAGRLDLHPEILPVHELCDSLSLHFAPQFEAKGVAFRVDIAAGLPAAIDADRQRLQQILRNLLSNACKFTEQGEVVVTVRPLYAGEGGVEGAGIAFEVRDTGIGVAAEKQKLIFEAFQQADGSTSRKYGGTGLGLSIAQQLARRMGGIILLSSVPGSGSTFTLCLPQTTCATAPAPTTKAPALPHPPPDAVQTEPPPRDSLPQPLPDDRDQLGGDVPAILIIEDDLRFAQLLIGLVRDRRFHALVAIDGETGIALADRYQPNAIILDVMLPHIDGWTVMRHLKDNPRTRHIPVHFVTCLDEEHKALAMGAVGYIRKPLSPQQLEDVFGTIEGAIAQTVRRLLVVEDNPREATAMVELLAERNVEITVVSSGREAIERLDAARFDCIVLDLGLADMTGFALLEHIRGDEDKRRIPVIIHSGQDLSREDEHRLRRYAESIIIKGAQSPDRLLNEVALFLHLVESGLSPGKQKMIRMVLDQEAMLAGKRVLIVDDDMRNIFSLSSILAEKQLIIIEAENGREALQRLNEHPDIDLVLMDIMMPEMDGYETMQVIRKDARFSRLPIIAMTAKALKGDQEKCLAAGASDYLSKPIDTAKLLSLLRVWLYPGEHR